MSKSEQKYMNRSFDSSVEAHSPEHKNVPLEEVHPERWYEVDLDTDEVREITDSQPPTVAENMSNDPPDQGTEDHQPNDESNSHVSIPVPEPVASGQTTGITYLHTYFRFLYAIGVSVYKESGEKGGYFIFTRLQAVVFVLLSVLAFLQAMDYSKYYYFKFVEKKDLEYFIIIGWNIFHCISAIYFVKFVAFDTKKISSMLDSLQHCSFSDAKNQNSHFKYSMRHLAISLGIISVILSLIKTMFSGFEFQSFLQGDSFLKRSYSVSRVIFLWKTGNLTDQLENLDENYGQEFTATTLIFGLVGTIMQYSGVLQHHVIRDIMLLAALTLFQLVANFESHLPIPGATEVNGNIMNVDQLWKNFKTLRDVSKNMTNALGTLLTFLHIKNLLLFTHFLLSLLEISNYKIELMIALWSIAKTSVTYVIAAKASRMNHTFRTWIHDQTHIRETFEIDGVEMSGLLLIEELKNEPIGLGSGASFISVSFFSKFFGYVTSCFLFFAKHDD